MTIATLEFKDWYERVHPMILTNVLNCDSNSKWQENHISLALLDALNDVSAEIRLNEDFITSYAIDKISGPLETQYGDIVVLVELEVNGMTIKGVAHFEAKRSYPESTRFKQIDTKQLEHMLTSSRAHSVLLYDIGEDSGGRYGVATAVNTSLVIHSQLKSEVLHSLGEDFLDKFSRYLAGRELDFDSDAIKAAEAAFEGRAVVAAVRVKTRFSPKPKFVKKIAVRV
jgi:hypothetical protein